LPSFTPRALAAASAAFSYEPVIVRPPHRSHRASNENIEEKTFARFLEFFDFRLLQQYLPTPDMSMTAPKEEKPPDGGFSIQPDDLGSRGHQCRDCTRTDCTHTYPSCERQVLSDVQTGQCRLSQGMEMHVEPD
jgi:hypothetical protein